MSTPTVELQITGSLSTRVDANRLRRAVETALAEEGVDRPAALTIVVVDDEEMSRFHAAYRGEPGPTDVLTFPFESPEGVAEEEFYLGDIVICWPQAVRQAEAEGHSWQDEVDLLAVHGVLHLLGYDDEQPDSRALMWHRQAEILERLGLGHVVPREA